MQLETIPNEIPNREEAILETYRIESPMKYPTGKNPQPERGPYTQLETIPNATFYRITG
jgi:hypothetical protein